MRCTEQRIEARRLIVVLDISAAFDTIDHSMLLNRLNHSFGIGGNALSLISSYLAMRSQTSRVGSASSAPFNCSCGMPQGSVLGQIFFTVYVSPITSVAYRHHANQQQYANDTQLYIAFTKQTAVSSIHNLQACLVALQAWFAQNGLALNPDKTEVIQMSTSRRAKELSSVARVNIAGASVKYSNQLKLLGVTLDAAFTFNAQIKSVSKASFHIRALRHIRTTLTEDLANTVACSLIQSRLDYANSLYSGMSSSNFTKLQHIQNTLARIVTLSDNRVHITPILKRLHWLLICQRMEYKVSLLSYNIRQTGEPVYLSALLIEHVQTRNLRSSERSDLDIPRTKFALASRAFSVAASRTWNSLPTDVTSAESLTIFSQTTQDISI